MCDLTPNKGSRGFSDFFVKISRSRTRAASQSCAFALLKLAFRFEAYKQRICLCEAHYSKGVECNELERNVGRTNTELFDDVQAKGKWASELFSDHKKFLQICMFVQDLFLVFFGSNASVPNAGNSGHVPAQAKSKDRLAFFSSHPTLRHDSFFHSHNDAHVRIRTANHMAQARQDSDLRKHTRVPLKSTQNNRSPPHHLRPPFLVLLLASMEFGYREQVAGKCY